MKQLILPVLVLSLLGITAAGAYPTPRTEHATSNELLVDVGHKGGKGHKHGNKHGNKHGHKYGYKHGGKWHHGGRNWNHRYRYRPIGWQLYGCVAAGPFWYCP